MERNSHKPQVTGIMNSQPMISVLMSTYKEPIEWLCQSIESILNQTFKSFEFIIVCDYPDYHDAVVLLQKYEKMDSRIVLILNEKNLGLMKSLNKGLRIAKGKYIARMDADDIAMPTRFEKQFAFMEKHPEIVVCGTAFKSIGKVPFVARWRRIAENNDEIKAQMMVNSSLAHPTVMIRNQVLRKYHIEYDEDYSHGEDYRLWEVLLDKGDFANLPEKLLKYRRSKIQESNSNQQEQSLYAAKVRKRIVNRYLTRLGIKIDLDNYHVLDVRKRIMAGVKDHRILKKDVYFQNLMKVLYYCDGNKPVKTFAYCILNGDFWMFSTIDKLRLLAMTMGHIKRYRI